MFILRNLISATGAAAQPGRVRMRECLWLRGDIRRISLLRLSLLRLLDSNFRENPYGHENSTPYNQNYA